MGTLAVTSYVLEPTEVSRTSSLLLCTTFNTYSGMLQDRNASNAFRMSSETTRQYFIVPPFHLVTAMLL